MAIPSSICHRSIQPSPIYPADLLQLRQSCGSSLSPLWLVTLGSTLLPSSLVHLVPLAAALQETKMQTESESHSWHVETPSSRCFKQIFTVVRAVEPHLASPMPHLARPLDPLVQVANPSIVDAETHPATWDSPPSSPSLAGLRRDQSSRATSPRPASR